ncbi:SDR family oxidoreductase [bacterium]|nr:SDR family oxidoreductase [bacterium]
MGEVVFFTGFPGFLGKRIAARVLADPSTEEVVFLVQHRFRPAAEDALAKIERAGAHAKATLVTGDITAPGCGMEVPVRERLRERVTLAFHLAAAYNLALARDVGMKVNVLGTRNVLDLLDGAPALKRLAYISTCAVSGSHQGVFSEEDFDVRQTFKNFYEETKYLAEAEVRGRWGRIPTVIFRPSVVVGDSKTGEAEKIDGPYYAFVMISRGLHAIAAKSSGKFHLVPVDFVADAMLQIFAREESVGRGFALSDPAPCTFAEFFDVTSDAFGKRRPLLRVPPSVLKPLAKFPGMAKLSGVPKQSFDYSLVPVDWPCANTLEALHASGLKCPRYPEYAKTLVRYFKEHLEPTMPKAGMW